MKSLNIFLFFLFLIFSSYSFSQNIDGLQIFVSKCCITNLYFHDDVVKSSFGETTSPYKIDFLAGDKNLIPLFVKSEVNTPYTFYINEGGRRHRFIIIYKDDISFAERENDFSDLKKLKKLTENPGNNVSAEPLTNNKDINNFPAVPNKQANDSVSKSTTNVNFAVLITEADELRKSGKLQEAKAKYEEALLAQSANSYALNNLQEVKRLIETQNAAKYKDFLTKGYDAFIKNNLEQALVFYTNAQAIKSDNLTSAQIQVIKSKLSAIKVEQENRRNDSLYNSYIISGDKALNEKLYNTAKIAYGEALKVKLKDAAATERLMMVDKKIITDSLNAENEKTEALYISYLKAGDKALEEKLYDAAKIAYKEALKIKHNDAMALSRMKVADQKINEDKLTSENERKENLYKVFINAGDKAFNEQLYDFAKINYDSALKIKTGDTYAKTQISKTNKALTDLQMQAQKTLDLQKDQERKKQYTESINLADEYYNSGNYNDAKNEYSKILQLNKNDEYAKKKLGQVIKILADTRAKEMADMQKNKQDSLNTIDYTALIAKADKDFETKDYANAKLLYTNALKYKKGDYSKNRINEIEKIAEAATAKNQAEKDSINKINEVNKKYTYQLINAKKAYDKNDFITAKIFYASATEIKPGEIEPKLKLKEIDEKLYALQKLKEQTNLADSLLSIADDALAKKDLTTALENYKAVLSMNQSGQSSYINKQINYIKEVLSTSNAVAKKQNEDELADKNEDLYNNYIKLGNQALKEKMYTLAKSNFYNALNIKVTDVYATNQLKQIENTITSDQIEKDSLLNTAGEETKNETSVQVKTANVIESNMVLIRAHLYKMGSDVGATDESPLHIVKINSFYISKYEVTQNEWTNIMGNNPSEFKNCDSCPVENISWDDASKFIDKLNKITNKNYRLPTEAEWEFVASAQNKKEGYEKNTWYYDNSKNKTHVVGQLAPNFLGIYDIFGNVEEWCYDWYDTRYYNRADTTNPQGPENGKYKVVRGGSWYNNEGAFRIQLREKSVPNKSSKKIGLRLALSVN